MPSVLPLVVRTSFRFNGRIHNDRFVTFGSSAFLALDLTFPDLKLQ